MNRWDAPIGSRKLKDEDEILRIFGKGNVSWNAQAPEKLLQKLPRDRAICMILLIPEKTDSEEDAAWDRLTAAQFFPGYDKADSIYDDL